MASKGTGQRVTPGKGRSTGQRSSRIRKSIVPRSTGGRKSNARYRLSGLTPRSLSARSRAIQVLRDLRSDPSLTFSQAAENRGVDPSTIHKYVNSALRKDDSGRVVARPSDSLRETLFIPSTKPDDRIPVPTKNNKERQLVGQWHKALNAAGKGDFAALRAFILEHGNSPFVGGVRLPTSAFQIQKLLEAQAESDAKLEGPYRTLARPA